MKRRKAEKIDRCCTRIIIILAVVLMVHMVATTIRGNAAQKEQRETETEETQVIEPVEIETVEPVENVTSVFDTMSSDWGGEEDGFVYYEIPEEYKRNGGYFPEKVQIYTYCLCKQRGVRYALIVAMIEHESGYRYDKTGDDGESVGYMQIMQKWHTQRMQENRCNDLLNPYQNIRVGIDYIAELIEKYGTIQDALAAYNYGEARAKKYLWDNGIYVYGYNEDIMSRMKEIEEVLQQ